MAPKYDRIPEISQVPEDLNELVIFLNTVIRQLNEVFAELNLSDSQFRGNDSFTPTFNNDVDLNRFRLRNISRSQDGGDAVTRRELEEIGILGSAAGILFKQPVTFTQNLFSEGPQGGGGSELPNNDDVSDMITSMTAGIVPVAVSGEVIDDQDVFANGTTEGTLSMARNGRGRADFLQIRNGQLQTGDVQACALLWLIYQELRSLRDAGNSD